MVREVVAGNSRDTRKQRRQHLGKLKHLIIQPQTRHRYEAAMRKFLDFLAWNKISLPSRYEEVDRLAAQYIEELWHEGDSLYLAQDVLSSLQHYEPQLKRKLLESWRLIKAWQKHEIPSRAPPLTPLTLSVLAGWFQKHHPELALALIVGFHGLLRTGEMLQVANKHIICSHDLVLIHLGQTKMAARNAGTESASFRDSQVSLMVQAWKSVHTPDALLVDMSASSFRQWFARGLQATGLDAMPYKPYSLRRGGATQVFLERQSYSAVCQRGRWASERTTRIYIQDSIALLTDIRTNLTVQQREWRLLWQTTQQKLDPSKAGRKRGRGG